MDTVVQKRKHPKAKKILITTEEILELGEKTVSKFLPREQQPTKEQERLMIALAIEQGILATFGHHYYSFDQGELRLHREGGPIGLKVSGAVGKVVLLSCTGEGLLSQQWPAMRGRWLPVTGQRCHCTAPGTGKP